MTNKKRKSKAGGGGGPSGGTGSAAGGGTGGSNSHKRPRFYDHPKDDASSSSRYKGGSANNKPSRFTNNPDERRGYYDPTHGQFGAFPGLEDDDGEFYGPANDGVDYLKMVRSEAKSVPTLLVAGQQYQVVKSRPHLPPSIPPQRPVDPSLDTLDYNDNGTDSLNYDDEPAAAAANPESTPPTPSILGEPENDLPDDECENPTSFTPSTPDPAGWYHDGTYTAAPPPPTPTPPPTALLLWHTTLLTSFRAFRHTFHTTRPVPFNANDLPPIPPDLKSWVRQRRWQSYVLHTAPTPRVLRAMTQLHVISALEALTGAPGVRKGVQGWWAEWVWGLLVRCELCLTAEEASVVRELGKKALNVRGRIVDGGCRQWMDEVPLGVGGTEEKEEEREDEKEEDPVGWVEPAEEEEDEIEEGEVGEGESDKAQPDHVVAIGPTEKGGDGGRTNIEPEVKPSPCESFVVNPDAIDLDSVDEPEATANQDATGETNPRPNPPTPAPAPTAVLKRKTRTVADTLGALDMAISIVGDFYGQRDLLDERERQAALVMS